MHRSLNVEKKNILIPCKYTSKTNNINQEDYESGCSNYNYWRKKNGVFEKTQG